MQVRFENCTPKSGPLETKSIAGGKCSWMMKDAERVVNALPVVSKTAAVPALVIAARIVGSGIPAPATIVAGAGADPDGARVRPSSPCPG